MIISKDRKGVQYNFCQNADFHRHDTGCDVFCGAAKNLRRTKRLLELNAPTVIIVEDLRLLEKKVAMIQRLVSVMLHNRKRLR